MKASLASRRTGPSFGILGTDLFRHPELMALRTFILLTIASTSALGAEFEPANFGKYEARFVGSIKFPEGSEDVDLALRCASPVSERGQVGRTSCANIRQPKVDQAFINAIPTSGAICEFVLSRRVRSTETEDHVSVAVCTGSRVGPCASARPL